MIELPENIMLVEIDDEGNIKRTKSIKELQRELIIKFNQQNEFLKELYGRTKE